MIIILIALFGWLICLCFGPTGFFHQPLSVHGWTSAFLLDAQFVWRYWGGGLSPFLPRWLRTGWQSVISQEKIP